MHTCTCTHHTHTRTCTHPHTPIHTHPSTPTHPPHTHTGKAQRLKEAKEEAAREIEDYRKQRELQFQEQQAKYAGSKDDFAQKMKADTDKKLAQISIRVDKQKGEVIDSLLELVYDIQPELHKNVHIQKKLK